MVSKIYFVSNNVAQSRKGAKNQRHFSHLSVLNQLEFLWALATLRETYFHQEGFSTTS
jgi:hypothetical protein